MKQAITSRKEIALLVNEFYQSVRADALLGPIFNGAIAEEEWTSHIEKHIDFWEGHLLGTAKFKGNPKAAHQKVDKQIHYGMEQYHFGQWLNLWFDTIERLFEGPNAEKAKNTARQMASGLYLAAWRARPERHGGPKKQSFTPIVPPAGNQ
ncbi:MAG: group III truncated hemoglobin [Salibacteraceae bacterium]